MGWKTGRGTEAALLQRTRRRDRSRQRPGIGGGGNAQGRRCRSRLPGDWPWLHPAPRRAGTRTVDPLLRLWRRRRTALARGQHRTGRRRRRRARLAGLRALELLHRSHGHGRQHRLGQERKTTMSDDKPLKSAIELAMERMARKDAEAGITSKPVTDEQKAAIAETRNFYEAKLAELEVLHQSK